MTVLRYGEIPHAHLEWFATLGEMHQVCIFPASLDGTLKLNKGATVQVLDRDIWLSAEIKSEVWMDRVWVLVKGEKEQREVDADAKSLRPAFDLVAIFGEPQQRAIVQLQLMSSLWNSNYGCNFGRHAQLALAEDGDWGTYQKYFHDSSFVHTYSNYVEKVLQPASGCAASFIGQMFFATGFREQRCSAALMIRDLENAYKNANETLVLCLENMFVLVFHCFFVCFLSYVSDQNEGIELAKLWPQDGLRRVQEIQPETPDPAAQSGRATSTEAWTLASSRGALPKLAVALPKQTLSKGHPASCGKPGRSVASWSLLWGQLGEYRGRGTRQMERWLDFHTSAGPCAKSRNWSAVLQQCPFPTCNSAFLRRNTGSFSPSHGSPNNSPIKFISIHILLEIPRTARPQGLHGPPSLGQVCRCLWWRWWSRMAGPAQIATGHTKWFGDPRPPTWRCCSVALVSRWCYTGCQGNQMWSGSDQWLGGLSHFRATSSRPLGLAAFFKPQKWKWHESNWIVCPHVPIDLQMDTQVGL